MRTLRETPFYRALHRPQLILGGDRKLMLLSLSLSVTMAVVVMNPVSFALGSIIALGSIYGLRAMAKADPLMWDVYLRHVKYADHYAPFSRPWRVAVSSRVY